MDVNKNSPSNIRTGKKQQFFNKNEYDGTLDAFIELFVEQGNEWIMRKETFDRAIVKSQLRENFLFDSVFVQVLSTNSDFVWFKEPVIQSLLSNSWRWSFRNTLKNLLKRLR